MRVKTLYIPVIIQPEEATACYEYLAQNIRWEEGIRSRFGFTRFGKALLPGDNPVVDNLVNVVIDELKKTNEICNLRYIYLNWYQNGTHYTPSHSHPKMKQFVISLGATRTLVIGTKEYKLENGDVILFGSSTHYVPKEPNVKEGRISIATFMSCD